MESLRVSKNGKKRPSFSGLKSLPNSGSHTLTTMLRLLLASPCLHTMTSFWYCLGARQSKKFQKDISPLLVGSYHFSDLKINPRSAAEEEEGARSWIKFKHELDRI